MLYDILFESAWKRFKRLAKTKSQMGMIAVFILGHKFESSSAFALHCSGGGVDENGDLEKHQK